MQLAVRLGHRGQRVVAQLRAAHLVRAEHRGAARADRDLVHPLDERVEVLAAGPWRERLIFRSASGPRGEASSRVPGDTSSAAVVTGP